jgi:tetratricopeptide (TPR) repeat protein
MRRENMLARLIRALSGKSQPQLAEEIEVYPSLIGQFETGDALPGHQHLEAMAKCAGITLADAEDNLRLFETRRKARRRWGRNAGELLDRMAAGLRSNAEAAYQDILTLPLQDPSPAPEDSERAEELFVRLERRTADLRLVMVEEAEEFQTWYLCERVCRESTHAASRDLEEAAAWVQLAQEIAARVRAPEGFRHCIQGYALAHAGNVVRVSGKLKEADATFEEAKRLWHSGSDPAKVLDPGRLLDLEASLRIDQRRLDEALARLEEAVAVGRCPERALIQKAITLEEMGQYEAAVEILLQAEPRVERAGDPRLLYSQRFNLAANLVHLGRYIDGAELIPQVREVAIDLGDEIFLSRITWLESRIAAGLGRTRQARTLLAEVRRDFELRHMSYDVALALLEKAILLLDAGQTAEVQVLADELTKVFADKGVHREALAALRLFYNAAKQEKATPDLARRVLQFLQRARHDQGLRFRL